jgi:hypothetical protein
VSATLPDGVPHSFPFRLIERVDADAAGPFAILASTAAGFLTRGRALPLTLVAEALAQAILLIHRPARPDSLLLVGLDRVELLQTVTAGDRVEIRVAEMGVLGALRRYSCEAWHSGQLAATEEVTVTG